mgnify:CR=1 FL=1
MRQRIITGLLLIGIGGLVIWQGGWILQIWLGIVSVMIAHEVSNMLTTAGHPIYRPILYLASILSVASTSFFPEIWTQSYMHIMAIIVVGLCILELYLRRIVLLKSPVLATLRMAALLTFTVPYIALVRDHTDQGILFMALCVIPIWVTDIAALYGGKAIGKTPLSSISPKKTVEGTLIGILSALIFMLATAQWLGLPLLPYLGLAILVSTGSQLGDLHESAIKRFCSVKDSGNALPGHGGFYDRADSTLYVFPCFFIIWQLGLL